MSDDGLYDTLFNEGLDEYHREIRKYYEDRLRDVHATKDYEIAMLKEHIRALKDENQQLRQVGTNLEQVVDHLVHREEHVDPRPSLDIPRPCACGATIIEQYRFDPAIFEIALSETKATITGTVVEVNIHDIDLIGGKLVCRQCHADVKHL